jgi:hypothetical protein
MLEEAISICLNSELTDCEKIDELLDLGYDHDDIIDIAYMADEIEKDECYRGDFQ